MDKTQTLLIITSLLTIVVHLDGVSVNPSLCPTNKIAPHRRAVSWEERSKPRTLGLLYGLLTPSRPRPPYNNDHATSELQEQPQEDDPNDCGDIEDYDETDLSSITPGAQNNYNNNNNKKEFGSNSPGYYPGRIWNWLPYRPGPTKKPQRQTPSVKPPFNSGGIYESHVYRPPSHHNPSTYIKPVHEYTYDRPQEVYSPGLVGGKPDQIVGFPTARPTSSNGKVTSQKRPSKSIRFPDSDSNSNRRARAKPPYVAASVIGSFVDLFFN